MPTGHSTPSCSIRWTIVEQRWPLSHGRHRFELRRLGSKDELLAPVAAIAHAAIVAAGPWLYTVLVILIVSGAAEPLVGESGLATFRVLLVYVFSLSLVSTAPITMLGVRLLADDLYRRQYDGVRSLYIATLLTSSVLTSLVTAIVFVGFCDTPNDVRLVGSVTAQIVSMVWVAVAFCGAMRDYLSITISFLLGLGCGAALAVAIALHLQSPVQMMWGFAGGFLLIFLGLTARFAATFLAPCITLSSSLRLLLARSRRNWALLVGATASALSIWIDKWIIWNSDFGERVDIGLVHAPVYDGPMFIASLTAVPGLALFVTSLETTFFDQYRRYFYAVDHHATLRRITSLANSLRQDTIRTLAGIITIQGVLCVIVNLSAPAIIEAAGLQFQQINLLRIATVGALFQFCFISCSTIFLFFDASRIYLALQLAFLATISCTTTAIVGMNISNLALGYMASCIILSLISIFPLLIVLRSVSFRLFVGSATTLDS